MEMRDMAQTSTEISNDAASLGGIGEPPLASLDGHIADDMGKLDLTGNHAIYTGSSHWVTILEDVSYVVQMAVLEIVKLKTIWQIRLLKDELSEEYPNSTSLGSTPMEVGPVEVPSASRISLLNSAPPLPRQQILAMVPPRKVVDRHVSLFFNVFDLAPFILHRQRFLAEYESFWANPSATPIMWVGLLSSVMSMSAFLQQQDTSSHGLSTDEALDVLNNYRMLTIQCLVAGNYLQPSRYTIETLTIHFAVDQNVNRDTSVENWILIGVVIRIALRMGLHRDPSHWPNIGPLNAELRRRLWMSLYQMDFFTSTQVGLPRIINDSQCDTRSPTHLFDYDLIFEDKEMPPERPLEDPTPLLYMIQRNKIIKVSAEIYDTTEAGPSPSAAIAALAAKLQQTIDDLPALFRYKPLETSIAVSPVTILHQIFLDILIHKAVYLLHRRSFVHGPIGDDSSKSNEWCIKAALEILAHQRRIGEETLPGGFMFRIRWKVVSSLNHEFLQATMMLCFAMSRLSGGGADATSYCALHREEILQAMMLSRSLWNQHVDQSAEARRAVEAITLVLQRDYNSSSALDQTPPGVFHQVPHMAVPSYFGGFDHDQSLALDPYFFTTDNDFAKFGSDLNDV
ncbi:hypothetical protein G7046_g8711 [Stylonectria norvegica]|nr:hypothetical protein G7046_g8711 [Stylonectria norvegica]